MRAYPDEAVFKLDYFDFLSFLKTIETKRIYHRSPIQTEISQPESKRIMLEMKFTKFPALSTDPRVGFSRSASETDI